MQTPAEVRLIDTLVSLLAPPAGREPVVLSIGAGTSTVVEDALVARGRRFVSDRVDLIDARVDRPYVRRVYRCSVESMPDVPSGAYDVGFSNYLLEHVRDLESAAREIFRVLKPGGAYVASVPNPTAPEFLVARATPLWFHRAARGREVGEKHYSYRSIGDLQFIFEGAGFLARDAWHFAGTEDYLERFGVLRRLARLYDRTLTRLGARALMGNVCLAFEKPEGA